MTKGDLLLYMCKKTAAIPLGYDLNIYSIPRLSKDLSQTKYSIRKLMKELEADGAVSKTYDGGIDEDGYPHCYHGWGITKQTRNTDMYKQCEKEALEEYEGFIREFDEEWRAKKFSQG